VNEPLPEPRELCGLAAELARAAAPELRQRFHAPGEAVRAKSSPTDLVGEADLAAEQTIHRLLRERRPQDDILAEEGGASPAREGAGSGLRWIVDPLDGTINYLFGIPQWSVSVACADEHGTVAGVIHDPLRDETFSAARDEPATLNGQRVSASERDDLATAMVATGFGYESAVRARQAEVVARVLPRVRDVRRMGSAALDLAWTSCGRFDAFYERGLQPWDAAAGSLICERAGLVVRRLEADGDLPGGLLAAPVAIADPLFQMVV
jgi:myo-inositol-1(or 4)-monophosphatase